MDTGSNTMKRTRKDIEQAKEEWENFAGSIVRGLLLHMTKGQESEEYKEKVWEANIVELIFMADEKLPDYGFIPLPNPFKK